MYSPSENHRHILASSDADWRNLIGTQYSLGGNDRAVGLSCYGLVREVYRGLAIDIPARTETDLTEILIAREGLNWRRVDAPEPYAVALMKLPGSKDSMHLGIVTPDGNLLHALPRVGVVCHPLRRYSLHILAFYVFQPDAGEHLPAATGGGIGRIIGSLLVTVAAFALAPLTMGGSIAAWGALSGWALAGAVAGASLITMAGNMIVNALFPLQAPDGISLSGWDGALSDSRQYTWDGIVNDARQGLAVPWLFGRIKVGGQIISEKTWFDGNGKEYLDVLTAPCAGPITRFNDVRLNDTEYLYYESTQVGLRPGDDEQAIIGLFDKIYTQYHSGAKIPYDVSTGAPTTSVQFTSKSNIAGCRLVVTAPRGIYELVGGTPTARSVVFRVQYQKYGESTWNFIPGGVSVWSAELPLISRASGAFSGAANPYTLTDAGSGGGQDANFSDRIAAAANFELVVGGTTYYCTQTGTLAASVIQFNAYTDSARTTAKTGALTSGAYQIQSAGAHYSVDGFGTGYHDSGFNTMGNCSTIRFTLHSYPQVDSSTYLTWARYNVYYRKSGDSAWILHNSYEAGCCTTACSALASWSVEIGGLDLAQYEVRVYLYNYCLTNPYGTVNCNIFSIDDLMLAEQVEYHTISGNSASPMTSVSLTLEKLSLAEASYLFRLWRTTADEASAYWMDDIYLNSYSEIIDAQCAYPGMALVGVRAMATDRLSGARPGITSVATGAPLSVPAAAYRYDTTVYADEGFVAGTGNIVNNTIVDGMRKIVVPEDISVETGVYYWLVRMNSSGYADPDHLLTKFYCRVHTWETAGTGLARLYIQSSESIPSGTSVMLFRENYGAYDHLAWAIVRMLIDGSRGRITADNIDWDSAAEFNAWCEAIVGGERRHTYDALIDFSADLWQIASQAARQGRCMSLPAGRQYRFVVDRAVEAPVSVFGEGNTRNAKVLPIPRQDRANVLVVSYLDAALNYEQRTISEEDVQSDEYPVVKSMPMLVGVTRESEARRYLRYLLRQNRYIDHAISFEAGMDSIAMQVGDVFAFQSQANDLAMSGKIAGASGDNLVIDRAFTPESDQTYKLYVWGQDAHIHTWTGSLSGSEISEIPCPAGFVPGDMYESDYILTTVAAERTLYRCTGITRSGDTLFATITGLQYAPEVYEAD